MDDELKMGGRGVKKRRDKFTDSETAVLAKDFYRDMNTTLRDGGNNR